MDESCCSWIVIMGLPSVLGMNPAANMATGDEVAAELRRADDVLIARYLIS
jgi:hypothetical protein